MVPSLTKLGVEANGAICTVSFNLPPKMFFKGMYPLRPQCYKESCAPLRPPAFCRAVFFLFYREKEKKPPTTPKKEKMRPKGTPLWKPAQECTSLYILELRVFLLRKKLVRCVLGELPVRCCQRGHPFGNPIKSIHPCMLLIIEFALSANSHDYSGRTSCPPSA